MPTDHTDKSSQGLPKDVAREAPVNPTGKGPCAPGNLPLLSWKLMGSFHQADLGAAVRIVKGLAARPRRPLPSVKIRGARMEWTLHCTAERQASRMHEMMKRLDVDALALVRQNNGEVYSEARSRCLLCQESVRCLRWLDGKSGGGPDFCPVLHCFDACRRFHSAAA